MIGANGFEPSTSWSRSGGLENLTPVGVALTSTGAPKLLPQLVHKLLSDAREKFKSSRLGMTKIATEREA